MDNRFDMDYILERKLNLDDMMDFKCNACGDCCRNRHDLLLTSYDVFRIAKCLNISPEKVVEKYCETYIGHTSRLPVVRVLPKTHDAVCPFLKNGKCSVHNMKPVVCSIFPLGRVHDFGSGEAFFFLQKTNCGGKCEPYTVKDWLKNFNIPEVDATARLWNETMKFSTEFMAKNEKSLGAHLPAILQIMLFLLYLYYDTNKDYEEQLARNSKILKEELDKIDLSVKE